MSEPTYTIKPLVWEREMWGTFDRWRAVGCARLIGTACRSDGTCAWFIESVGGSAAECEGLCDSAEAANLATESAYRRLLAEHLVEVK